MTALYVASQNGHVEVVNILLQKGAHVDVQDEVSLTFHIRNTDRAVKLYVSQENDSDSFIGPNVHIVIFARSGQVDSSDDSIPKWTC